MAIGPMGLCGASGIEWVSAGAAILRASLSPPQWQTSGWRTWQAQALEQLAELMAADEPLAGRDRDRRHPRHLRRGLDVPGWQGSSKNSSPNGASASQ